jgi:hypothetical protein
MSAELALLLLGTNKSWRQKDMAIWLTAHLLVWNKVLWSSLTNDIIKIVKLNDGEAVGIKDRQQTYSSKHPTTKEHRMCWGEAWSILDLDTEWRGMIQSLNRPARTGYYCEWVPGVLLIAVKRVSEHSCQYLKFCHPALSLELYSATSSPCWSKNGRAELWLLGSLWVIVLLQTPNTCHIQCTSSDNCLQLFWATYSLTNYMGLSNES